MSQIILLGHNKVISDTEIRLNGLDLENTRARQELCRVYGEMIMAIPQDTPLEEKAARKKVIREELEKRIAEL
jgi:predicted kinase